MHPMFPRYNIRIKKSHEFCDPSVKYISSNSRSGFQEADLILSARILGTLILRLDIYSSISSRVATILIQMM